MSHTKKLVFAGLCAALGLILPMVFHTVPGGGTVFLPMHLPILLCGLLCGPWYGLACGVITPILSSLLTQMPAAAALPGMTCELAVYGLTAGLLLRLPIRRRLPRLYLALVGAMLAGRVAAGLLNGLLFRAGSYSLSIWLTASFVTALPGILIQLVLLPGLVLLLCRANLCTLPD